MEIMRYATITPLGGPPHKCLQTFNLNGHLIPKGAVMFANIFAVHRDESIWPDPYHFNPNNFYDEATKTVKNVDYLIPFGIGRRSCLGESLAKQELFVIYCGLLHLFETIPPPGKTMPAEDSGRFTRFCVAPAFQIVMKRRNIDIQCS